MTHTLHRYLTGEALRPATFDERRRYREATLNSGVGLGVILVDDLPCYVEDGSGYADPACREQAWEAYDDACASWGETAAEVGASHFMSTRNACDASLVGQWAAGRIPQPADYGVTRSPPSPPPPSLVDHDDDEIPF
jgi:hypothetical protein